jgi:hypothetical protein
MHMVTEVKYHTWPHQFQQCKDYLNSLYKCTTKVHTHEKQLGASDKQLGASDKQLGASN